jgi:Type VI secretion system effector, Hcp
VRLGRQVAGWWRAAALLAAGAVGGAAAVAVASVPGSDGVIHACYAITDNQGTTEPVPTIGNIRIIDPSVGQTCSNPVGAPASEATLAWNATGPAGTPGTPGATGQPGTVTTVTVGSTPVLLTAAPGKSVGTLTISGTPTVRSGAGTTEFQLVGFEFSRPGGAVGTAARKAGELTITKHVDKSSPALFKACATGQHFNKVTISLRKAGGGKTLTYKLSNVVIGSIERTYDGEQPTEVLTLDYTKVEIAYSS